MREHLLLPVQLVRATPYHEGEIWLTTCCLFESSHHLSLADLCVCLLNEIVPLGFTEESQKVGNAMSSWCFLIIFYIIFLHNISFFFFFVFLFLCSHPFYMGEPRSQNNTLSLWEYLCVCQHLHKISKKHARIQEAWEMLQLSCSLFSHKRKCESVSKCQIWILNCFNLY